MDNFRQDDVIPAGSVDLLFVTDTSGSLDAERAGIADGIDRFIEELPTDVDFRVGVLLGHGSTSQWAGKLYGYGNTPKVLNSETMTLAAIRSSLRTNLTRTAGDNDSDGGEEVLYSFNRAITTNLAHNRQLGFFRPDAALAVIFITDENDICYPGTVRDGDGKEPTAYNRDCLNKGITASNILTTVRALQGERPLNLSTIAYTNRATVPAGGENEYALGVVDIVMLANGILADMSRGAFDDALADIGKLTAARLLLKTEFRLTRPNNVKPITVTSVTVDGVAVPYTYVPTLNEVHIAPANAGRLNSVIVVTYRQ